MQDDPMHDIFLYKGKESLSEVRILIHNMWFKKGRGESPALLSVVECWSKHHMYMNVAFIPLNLHNDSVF